MNSAEKRFLNEALSILLAFGRDKEDYGFTFLFCLIWHQRGRLGNTGCTSGGRCLARLRDKGKHAYIDISVDTRVAIQLVTSQVGVVTGRDVVVG